MILWSWFAIMIYLFIKEGSSISSEPRSRLLIITQCGENPVSTDLFRREKCNKDNAVIRRCSCWVWQKTFCISYRRQNAFNRKHFDVCYWIKSENISHCFALNWSCYIAVPGKLAFVHACFQFTGTFTSCLSGSTLRISKEHNWKPHVFLLPLTAGGCLLCLCLFSDVGAAVEVMKTTWALV